MRFFYYLYQLFIAIPLFLLSTIITAVVTAVGSMVGDSDFWGYYPGKWWGRFTCAIFLLPVRIERHDEIDRNQSYVFIANHQGSMDIFLIYGYLGHNFKWMMKYSLRKVPFVGFACEKARHIFVDRRSPRKVEETIQKARHTLQDGMSLMVFPEGSRSFTGHMGKFKKGAFQLAEELQLPIVPITIDGAFDVLPRTRGFNFCRRHPLRLVFHAPIAPPADVARIREKTAEAYDIVMSGLPERHQGYVENKDQ